MKSVIRIALAVVAATIAPVAPFAIPPLIGTLLTMDTTGLLTALMSISSLMLTTSAFHVLVFGLPAFLILRRLNAVRWWTSTLAGFLFGCLPMAISFWPRVETEMQTTSSHWDGERMVHTMIDGVPTTEAWIQWMHVTALFGAFGAVGGIAFWAVWRGTEPRPRADSQ